MYRAAALAALLTLTTASCVSTSGPQAGSTASPSATQSTTPTQSSTTPAAVRTPWLPTDPAFGEIQQLLDRRAKAIADRNQAAFNATLDTSDQSFVDLQDTEFANLAKLDVTDVSYSVVNVAYAPAEVNTSDPLLRPQVIEHVKIPGIDRKPVGNSVNFTFVEHDGTWLLAAEQFPTTGASSDPIIDYTDPSQSRPWAPGPIAVARKGHVVVVTDESRASQGPALAKAIKQGIADDDAVLGLHSSARLLVDSTSNSTDGFSWTYAGADYAAFTFPRYALNKEGNADGLAGWGIKLNPNEIASLMKDSHVLHHELNHYVMRVYGIFPTWLSEGLAEYVGWYPSTLSDLQVPSATYKEIVKAADTNELPPSAVFQSSANVNYPIAQGAVTYLVKTCGMQGVLDLIKSYKGHTDVGSGDGYTRTALEKVCHTTQADVAAGALAEVKTLHQY